MISVMRRQRVFFQISIWLQTIVLGAWLLSACSSPGGPDSEQFTATDTTHPTVANPSPTPFQPQLLSPTPYRIRVWLSPALPARLQQPIEALRTGEKDHIEIVEDASAANVRVEPGAETPLANWVYAVVAPFPTVRDGISWQELKGVWEGTDGLEGRVYASVSTVAALEWAMGLPAQANVVTSSDRALIDLAWSDRAAMAVVPFEALEPRWKVFELDGDSPIRIDFNQATYPLIISFGLSGEPESVSGLREILDWPATNRDQGRLTVVVMTGTTALTRATAWMMEIHGISFPGEKVGDWLREADFTHISNEVSFTETCPPPDPIQAELRFCSAPEYLQLLEEIGADMIELTGNHVLDWGEEAFLNSLNEYRQRGWLYFGGGENLTEATQAVRVEHNGNKLAFLGCNEVGPSYAWATSTTPGAASCNEDHLSKEIELLREEGYLPIFTYQWAEGASVLPAQMAAFRETIDAGAVIVSGSQAHQPLGFELYQGGFVHYGLGNLFFDQMQSLELRQEFIDRHVFYDGRHISTELLTAILEDYAQPRPMTPDERAPFLAKIFKSSGW
jgi:hypothetical protein